MIFRYYFLLILPILINCGCSSEAIPLTLKGNVIAGLKSEGVEIQIFDNGKYLQNLESSISYFSDSSGNFSCNLTIDPDRPIHKFNVVYRKKGFLPSLCEWQISKKDYSKIDKNSGVILGHLDNLQLMYTSHASHISVDTILAYKKASRLSEKRILETKNYIVLKTDTFQSATGVAVEPPNMIFRSEGKWLKIIHTSDLVKHDTSFIFYNDVKKYQEAHKCYLAYLEPFQKCNFHSKPIVGEFGITDCDEVSFSEPLEVLDLAIYNSNQTWVRLKTVDCDGWVLASNSNFKSYSELQCIN